MGVYICQKPQTIKNICPVCKKPLENLANIYFKTASERYICSEECMLKFIPNDNEKCSNCGNIINNFGSMYVNSNDKLYCSSNCFNEETQRNEDKNKLEIKKCDNLLLKSSRPFYDYCQYCNKPIYKDGEMYSNEYGNFHTYNELVYFSGRIRYNKINPRDYFDNKIYL